MFNLVAGVLWYKYAYITLIALIILLGSMLVDSKQRLARILRILGYILVIAMIPLSIYVMRLVDFYAYPFLFLLGLVGIASTIYVEGYSRVLLGIARSLQLPLDVFSISLLLLYSSSTLIEFVVFWIITELIGFMIILTEGTRKAWRAAIQYLMVSALTADFSLFTLLAIVSYHISLDKAFIMTFQELAILGVTVGSVITILLVVGFLAKAALVPLHFWLPDAYTLAPSPASAVLSGVMEKMSIFGVLRILEVVKPDLLLLEYLLIILGSVTTIYASAQALVQRDTKRLLSYSTMAYSGILMALLGVYIYTGFDITVLYTLYMLMIAHGVAKSLLFLNAGSIEILANTRDIYELGYLSRIDSSGAFTMTVGVLSLLGAPSTIGFAAKFATIALLVSIALNYGLSIIPVIVALLFLSASGLVYGLKYLSSYYGGYKPIRSKVLKYYLLSWAENYSSAVNLGLGLVIPLLFQYTTLGLLVLFINFVALLGLIMSYIFILGQKKIRTEEIWLGGAYP